ncbi:MarR family winged helix-turn-helix transcriptional regulator [Massilia sp. ST3]|uniref:MarR family winged helix-turn-helix transcriptional regulator n=1 Tax=Massilia sp. ST3 TaxID=2824903 RepID=UPI001B814970|nr:MarR family winged helix-turn-helix transcriptional regulator [Massilia sp. ST3]MBQ5946104.1 winged helix-turn-helix transcriptional regulator [Massilia sp. ST3]
MNIEQLAHTPCYCSSLRQASRYLTSFYDQVLSGTGLRVTQFSILAKLLRGSANVNQLAKAMVMDRTTLARNLQPLVREDLVVIRPSEQDRRERVIELSGRGREVITAARPAWERAQQLFEEHFGQLQADEMRAMMAAVVGSGVHEALGKPVQEAAADDAP